MNKYNRIKADGTPNKAFKISEEQRAVIISMRKAGKKMREIVEETGLSDNCIRTYCARLIHEGLIPPRRKQTSAEARLKQKQGAERQAKYRDRTRDSVIYEYYVQGKGSHTELAKIFGLSETTIWRIIHTYRTRELEAENEKLKKLLRENGISIDD